MNITNSEQIQESIGVSVDEYDEQVIVPLLQQEALKQQELVESTEELYVLLVNRQSVYLLLLKHNWDNSAGLVQW